MNQEATERPAVIIIVLAILTIFGSLFTILRAFFYELIGSVIKDPGIQIRAIMYVVASIGTIIGAIMMILRKLSGLYVYTAFQVLYIITISVAVSVHDTKEELSSIILFFFGAPSVLFLILYWLQDVRKYLN